MAERKDRVIAFTGKYHGLGNRLRVTLGSLSLAEWAGRDFAYTWPTGSRFGASMDELWNFSHRRVSPLTSTLLSARHPYRDASLSWLDDAASDRLWQVRTAHALALPEGATPWGEQLQALTPVDDLAERITAFHGAYLAGRPYIGVMIRTHPISNAQTLQHSPLEWFIERMTQLRSEDPSIAFFVSCDELSTQRRVLDTFDDAYALTDKGGYNTAEALRSSVVDLYLLAGASHVIAPHYSSFPEIALELAGSGLRMETSQTGIERRFGPWRAHQRVHNPLQPGMRVPAS